MIHTYTLDYVTTGHRTTVRATRAALLRRLIVGEGWEPQRATSSTAATFHRAGAVLVVELA